MRKSIILSLALCAAACGSSKPAEKKTEPAAVTQSEDEAGCVKLRQRQRECTDAFIPALVDMRIKADVPPGIAAAAQKDGRDAIVAQAMEEWKQDSTDEAIARNCKAMPAPPSVTAEQRETARKCLDLAECQAFVDCFLPVLEQIFKAGPPPKQEG